MGQEPNSTPLTALVAAVAEHPAVLLLVSQAEMAVSTVEAEVQAAGIIMWGLMQAGQAQPASSSLLTRRRGRPLH